MKPEPKTSRNAENRVTRKVSFLSRPESYVQAPETVVTREIHMSWVFMTGERVYKLKKQVRFSFNKESSARGVITI
jgi:aminoglycoside phosphotransferase family enzyme